MVPRCWEHQGAIIRGKSGRRANRLQLLRSEVDLPRLKSMGGSGGVRQDHEPQMVHVAGALLPVSEDCLQVGAHHILDSADFRIVEEGCELEGLSDFVEFQCFQHHVHADLVSEFEAVGDGFFR